MEPDPPPGSSAPAAADEVLHGPTDAAAVADRLASLARFDRWVRLLFLALAALGFGLGVMAAADDVAGTSGAVGVATIFHRQWRPRWLPAGERRDIGQGTDRSWAIVYAATYAAVSLLPLIVG